MVTKINEGRKMSRTLTEGFKTGFKHFENKWGLIGILIFIAIVAVVAIGIWEALVSIHLATAFTFAVIGMFILWAYMKISPGTTLQDLGHAFWVPIVGAVLGFLVEIVGIFKMPSVLTISGQSIGLSTDVQISITMVLALIAVILLALEFFTSKKVFKRKR